MKKLEIKQMSLIEGGGFWGGFCGTMAVVRGAGAVAVILGTAVPGLNVITAIALISCGIYAVSEA